jgi:hypothetical protein
LKVAPASNPVGKESPDKILGYHGIGKSERIYKKEFA